ncbi:MAG TPA: glycine cleavage system aminomethyltransferase GcvT [Chloroflexota bacterium]|jgi:aminomethyltransferase
MTGPLRETPLHGWHVAHGARLVPFGGWSMPVQYPTGILAEHRATRAGASLFDISHMGRVAVRGPDALALLQRTTTNDVGTLGVGRAQYTLLCNEDGGTLDDLIVYWLADHYLAVVNAGGRERDLIWWQDHARGLDVELIDRTAEVAMIALQGPAAETLLRPVCSVPLDRMRYYTATDATVCGVPVMLARTGYTGEDGFELMPASEHALALWEALLGRSEPVQPGPAGLGARDTLRLEAGMALYGHELTDEITPLEAGLGRFVKLDKSEFVGRAALAAQQAGGVTRQLVAFEMVDSAIPRQGYPIVAGGGPVGAVTSGSFGPSVERQIGMGYVPPGLAGEGTELGVVVRERTARARVRPLPFWPHRTKRIVANSR